MKNLAILTQTLFFVILSFGILKSQTTASVYIKKYADPASIIIKKNLDNSTSTIKSDKKNVEVYYDISDVDMSTIVDIKTNTIDFSGERNHKYTKIQLTEKHSNKTIISRKIKSDYRIDINAIEPGSYLLILSNDKGEIKSEDVIILQ